MKIKSLPYHLGIIIPCSIILFNGYTSYYAVFQADPYEVQRNFALAYCLVWITYIIAIFKKPGYASKHKIDGGKYVECAKCELPKPERAHHCKTCNKCVLRMDHHCPWTENCVGFENLPHFLRFLTSAILVCGYCCYRNVKFLLFLMHYRRHLKRVLPQRLRMYISVVSLLANAFIVLTLALLWGRVIGDTFNNQTQIETWEIERVYILNRRRMAEFVSFPFDINPFYNLVSAIGPLYNWLWLNGKPSGPGHAFRRNSVSSTGRWPPEEPERVKEHEYYRKNRWISFEGETLKDFGVEE